MSTLLFYKQKHGEDLKDKLTEYSSTTKTSTTESADAISVLIPN